ncbi:hypothetical protein ACN24L_27005 [Streptomyces microflavus]
MLAATLLPAEAWAIAPPTPRIGPSLVDLQQEKPADPDQAKIDELSSWSGTPVEPRPTTAPPPPRPRPAARPLWLSTARATILSRWATSP